jgi:hypothetical protein
MTQHHVSLTLDIKQYIVSEEANNTDDRLYCQMYFRACSIPFLFRIIDCISVGYGGVRRFFSHCVL